MAAPTWCVLRFVRMLRVRGAVLLNVTCGAEESGVRRPGWAGGFVQHVELGLGHLATLQLLSTCHNFSCRPAQAVAFRARYPSTRLGLDVRLRLLQRRLRRQLLLHQGGGRRLRLLRRARHRAGGRWGNDALGGQALQEWVEYRTSSWSACTTRGSGLSGEQANCSTVRRTGSTRPHMPAAHLKPCATLPGRPPNHPHLVQTLRHGCRAGLDLPLGLLI